MTEFRSRLPGKAAIETGYYSLAGPADPASIDGYRYSLSFTDDYSL